jgi:hypothetical protein
MGAGALIWKFEIPVIPQTLTTAAQRGLGLLLDPITLARLTDDFC